MFRTGRWYDTSTTPYKIQNLDSVKLNKNDVEYGTAVEEVGSLKKAFQF
jgi:hypothetical protein